MRTIKSVVVFDIFREKREKLRLTQEEVAKKAKVPVTAVRRFEGGIEDTEAQVVQVVSVARVLGLSAKEVFA